MRTLLLALATIVLGASSALAAADAPQVAETYPVDGARDIPIGTNVYVTFDRRMDPATVDPAKILVNGRALSDIEEAGAVMPDPESRQLVILFRMHLEQIYRITLLPGLADTQGNTLRKPVTWKFAAASRSDDPDMPPKIFARYPRYAELDVPTNTVITMLFTTEMDPASLTPETVIVRRHVDGTRVTGTVRGYGQRVVFQPDTLLESRSFYEATITTGVRSKSGLNPIVDSTWDFNTGEGPIEGSIVADAWVESFTDDLERRIVLHAAIENLVLPGKRATLAQPAVGALGAGQSLRATVIPASALEDDEPAVNLADGGAADPSVAAAVSAEEESFVNTDPSVNNKSTVVIAAYTGTEERETLEQKLTRVAGGFLGRPDASHLQDSGNLFTHGDRSSGDGVYSARVFLSDKIGAGPGLATFSIVLPNGEQTPPVAVPFYITPPPGEELPEGPANDHLSEHRVR